MSAEIAVQTALRARLIATPAVMQVVPPASILDAHKRPAPRPSILLGESLALRGSDIARRRELVTHTIHVYVEEPSTEGMKNIVAIIRDAILAARLDLAPAYHCADWDVVSTRSLRDPDGETSHGVVTVEVLAERLP